MKGKFHLLGEVEEIHDDYRQSFVYLGEGKFTDLSGYFVIAARTLESGSSEKIFHRRCRIKVNFANEGLPQINLQRAQEYHTIEEFADEAAATGKRLRQH